MTEYAEFRVRIERGPRRGSYRVEASAFGASRSGTFKRPFTDKDLENFVLRVGRPRRGVRRMASPEWDLAKTFGSTLFGALIHGPVAELYREAAVQAQVSKQGLRITLSLTDVPEVGTIPWEYLFDDPSFLSISTATPVVRFLDLPHPRPPLAVELPIRILGVISAPTDYPTLDTAAERAKLEAALKPLVDAGAVAIEWLEEANLLALHKRMQRDTFQILHYIGHGGFDNASGQGALLLEDATRHSEIVSGEQLATILNNKNSLRLVFLNSCEGARNSVDDPFSGVATSLVERSIPAVIGMQFEITDRAAVLFASEFYAMLAEGQPVDAAVTEARLAIFADHNDVEWATPVLFLRVADGRLFDVANAGAIPRADPQVLVDSAAHDAATATSAGPVPPPPVSPAPPEGSGTPVVPLPVPLPVLTPEPAEPEPEQLGAGDRGAAAAPAAGAPTAGAPANEPDVVEPETAGPDAIEPAPTAGPPVVEPVPTAGPASVAPMPFVLPSAPVAEPPGPASPAERPVVPEPAPPPPPTTVGADGPGSPDAALPDGRPPRTVVGDAGSVSKSRGRPRRRWRPIAIAMAAVLVLLVAAAVLLPRPDPSTGALHVTAGQGIASVSGSGFVGGENVTLGLDGEQVMTVKARADGSFDQDVPIGDRQTGEIEAFGQSGRQARTSFTLPFARSPSSSAGPSGSGAAPTVAPTATPTHAAAVPPCDIAAPAPVVADPTSPGILFYTHNKGSNDNRRIYFLAAPGATPKPLTDGSTDDTYPAWSPDHTRIVFSRGASPDGPRRLYIATFANGELGKAAPITSGAIDKFPTWSANGCIAFARTGRGIYVINPNRTGIARVVDDASAGAPDWSPDGLTIAYMARHGSDLDIFTIRPGGEPNRLVLSDADDATPKWSPDGTRIAYAHGAFNTDHQDVYVVDVEPNRGTPLDTPEPLTDTHPDADNPALRDCNPAWSPAGDAIVFYRGPRSSQEYRLWTIGYPAGSTPAVQLTDDPPGPVLDPAWR